MNQFGELVRKLREEKNLLLRELAAQLEIDPAILSKIERGERKARKEQLTGFAIALEYDDKKLKIIWLADRIQEVVENEKEGMDALHLAEKLIKYGKQQE